MLKIRPWRLEDAQAIINIRNKPELMKWFRQNEPLTLEQQQLFMITHTNYKGHVVEYDGQIAGFVSLVFHDRTDEAEFGIAIDPAFWRKGLATAAMKYIIDEAKTRYRLKRIYSEVFELNPALTLYTEKFDFTVVGFRHEAYFKKDDGMVNVFEIELRF